MASIGKSLAWARSTLMFRRDIRVVALADVAPFGLGSYLPAPPRGSPSISGGAMIRRFSSKVEKDPLREDLHFKVGRYFGDDHPKNVPVARQYAASGPFALMCSATHYMGPRASVSSYKDLALRRVRRRKEDGAWVKGALVDKGVDLEDLSRSLEEGQGEQLVLESLLGPIGGPGTVPFDPSLKIPEEIWSTMGQSAQEKAQAAGRMRAKLAGIKALTGLKHGMTVKEAEALGIEVVSANGGNLVVGCITVPALVAGANAAFPTPPGFSDMRSGPTKLYLLGQRTKLALQFVEGLSEHGKVPDNNQDASHVLSGVGVGKSGVGLLTALVAAARGLPVCYVPPVREWIDGSHESGQRFDDFIMDAFVAQNADLIAASADLRWAFQEFLRGSERITYRSLERLRAVAEFRCLSGNRIGFIVDDLQKLSDPQERPYHKPIAQLKYDRSWFPSKNQRENRGFMTMSFTTPDDVLRMRYYDVMWDSDKVLPMTDAERRALQSHPLSPAYLKDEETRRETAFIHGNMLGKLVHCAEREAREGKLDFRAMFESEWSFVRRQAEHWYKWLCEESQWRDLEPQLLYRRALGTVMGNEPMMQDEFFLNTGIMTRFEGYRYSRAVSPLAAAVLLRVFGNHASGKLPLSSTRRKRAELVRRVVAALDGHSFEGVTSKTLNGDEAPSLNLRSTYCVPFHDVEEVRQRDVPVLYLPIENDRVRASRRTSWDDARPLPFVFGYDAIFMPAAGSGSNTVYFLECNPMSPRSADRLNKVQRVLFPDGPVRKLLALHPHLTARVVLAYDGVLKKATRDSWKVLKPGSGAYKDAVTQVDEATAKEARAELLEIACVVDHDALTGTLGVTL